MELHLNLDRSRRVPLAIQIAHAVRKAIAAQPIAAGTRLPATRALAQRLGVSRMVVVEAYEWLIAEGFVEGRAGSGTYVAAGLRESTGPTPDAVDPPRRTDVLPERPLRYDFRPGLPALDLFPRRLWRAALSRAALQARPDLLGYGPVEGLPQLRRLIAEYVARTRGLRVEPQRVVVTLGTAQAMDLVLRALSPVRAMALEDPGPEPVRRLARLHGVDVVRVPVDSQGMRVGSLPVGRRAPQVVHVIPSHQYPTGAALRLERRLELLRWADEHDAVLLEDDYDSEFRFDQAPPIALAALDSSERVVYLGSFSKTIFPGLRLGFGVLPERLMERVLELKWFSDRCTPVLEQLALADWLESGVFERHVRKMRSIYARRRQTLLAALDRGFGERVRVGGVPAGMHVLAEFDLGLSASDLIARAADAGVGLYPVGDAARRRRGPGRVVLGFGHLPEALIARGIARLARAFTG